MRRRTRAVLGLAMSAFVALSMAGAPPARAQSAADRTAAEALYEEGKKLLGEQRYAEACKRFEASQRLDPGVGTLLFLADCYEMTGRIASAWSTFREAASAAKATGRADREQLARERAAKLDGKLFQLTLSVGGAGTEGLKVMRGEIEVKKEVWGLAVPVDPGTYEITVSAPGKKPWSTTIEIPQAAGSRTVEVPALADAPAPVQTATPTVTAPTAPPPPQPAPGGWSSGRTAGLALGIGGVVTMGVGGIFGGLAASKYSEAKTLCPNTACGDASAVSLSQESGTMADVSTALFVAGGAVLAGGVVLFLVSPSSSAATPSTGARPPRVTWISPMIGGGAAGLGAGSTW